MNTAKYPNRDALRDANDIYLDTMRPFIIRQLKQVRGGKIEDLISRILKPKQRDEFQRVLNETDDIESAIDFSYFPHIIEKHWSAAFVQRFDEDLKFQSMLWLIREGRNSCEHRGTKDLNSEFVRVNLFLISEVLAKINTDKQREVEAIRDELFFDDSAERLEKAEKDIAEYERSLAETKECLAAAESERSEYAEKDAAISEQVDTKERKRKTLDRQLKDEKKRNAKLRSDLSGTKKRLEESEAAQADYKKRLEDASRKLKETKEKLIEDASKKLKETKEKLKEFKATKTKSWKKKPTIVERFESDTTEADRNQVAVEVAKMRINATGSKPLAWRKIREKLGLKNDEFHKVIRPSSGYRAAVIDRIKSLKAQEGGWEYSGNLERLTGIPITEEELA